MRPKDLKSPFTSKPKEVFVDLSEQILFMPARCNFPCLKDTLNKVFSKFSSVHIEFCSGNGHWIAEKARKYPEILWVAVEKKFDRVQKIWSKMKNDQLSNYFIVCGDAFDVCREYFETGLFDAAYINFPDPWPKKKHAKFRLMQPFFISQLERILKNKGLLYFVTDDLNYSQTTLQSLIKEPSNFESLLPCPYYESNLDNYGPSYFRSLWEEKKRGFYFSKFQKTCKYEF